MDKQFVPTAADKLQFGDTIILNSKELTIKGIMGPDRIGTYDLYLYDKDYNASTAFVNGIVTVAV